MKRVAFAIPGDLDTPTGGYAYDRRMIAELTRLGWHADVIDIGSEFPRPSASARAAALAENHTLVALVHHPLALESGLSHAEAKALHESERGALGSTRHVIVTGAVTARLLASDYGVAPERITIALPGTDPVQPARRVSAQDSRDGPPALLAVGALVPRKGYDVLIAALAPLAALPWRLTIAGDRTRDEAASAQLDADIASHGLADRIDVLGALPQDRLASLYVGSDLFVLASRFEGYGMAFAEALVHGLPVVGTTAGAVPDTVPPDAGVLVEPDDVKALTRTLRMLIENPKERQWFASGALAAGAALPTWEESAKLLAGAIEALA